MRIAVKGLIVFGVLCGLVEIMPLLSLEARPLQASPQLEQYDEMVQRLKPFIDFFVKGFDPAWVAYRMANEHLSSFQNDVRTLPSYPDVSVFRKGSYVYVSGLEQPIVIYQTDPWSIGYRGDFYNSPPSSLEDDD